MELLNKASDSFFLLKKRLNPDDINELISSSNKSLVTIIKNHNKKPKEIPIPKKPDNKVLLKPPTNINTIGNKLASLLEIQTQKQNDKKDNANNLFIGENFLFRILIFLSIYSKYITI